MAADTYDVITVAEAKTALNIPAATSTYDTRVQSVVTAVSQRLVDLCGPVVARTFTDEKHDGGDGSVYLRQVPPSKSATVSVTAVKEYDTAGALTTLSEEDHDTKPADAWIVSAEGGERNRVIRRSSGGDAVFASGRSNVLVTYSVSRAATTATVPEKFKLAAEICVSHIWSNLGAMSGAARPGGIDGLAFTIPPWAIPKAATDLLHEEMLGPGVS